MSDDQKTTTTASLNDEPVNGQRLAVQYVTEEQIERYNLDRSRLRPEQIRQVHEC